MKFASVFQDRAVLQHGLPLPVWGTARPGEKVVVRLAGAESSTTADARGEWFLRLPPLAPGGPFELSVAGDSGAIVLQDILLGDVWICSGQSNMEWKLELCGPEWLGDACDQPRIRILTVASPALLGKTGEVFGEWRECTRETLASFSAVAGYFAAELHRALDLPIGVICNALGGTRIQAWISRESLVQDPAGREEVAFYESRVWRSDISAPLTFAGWEKSMEARDSENRGLARGWASRDHDDAAWPFMEIPSLWQNCGHPHSGVFWFRKSMEIPGHWLGAPLELSLGAIDKHDETWVNGRSVGSMGWETPNAWCTHRSYHIPADLVGPDRKISIAVRARSHVHGGGMTGPEKLLFVRPEGSEEDGIPLAGPWRYEVEQDWGLVLPPEIEWGADNPNSPHILFDNRIAPLLPYGIRGAIWYQGEGNAGEASLYARLFPLMIRDWRRAWGQGDFPFHFVQLANYLSPPEKPVPSQWAALREAQLATLSLPRTGMAVAIDIGESLDIHPKNKRDVGRRLAQSVLSESFGFPIVPTGPIFERMTIEPGGRVRCFFRHVGSGLVAKGDRLRHFALAGKDRMFHWADAAIEGSTVVVSSEAAPEPMAVRYAWADNPEGCNLFNKDGLPASPFRSDSWAG